jgi:hypothetical protein
MKFNQLNWAAAIVPLAAAAYLTYQEVRDDHDNNEVTVFNAEYVYAAWGAALALLLGTTTTGQTKAIANSQIEKQ